MKKEYVPDTLVVNADIKRTTKMSSLKIGDEIIIKGEDGNNYVIPGALGTIKGFRHSSEGTFPGYTVKIRFKSMPGKRTLEGSLFWVKAHRVFSTTIKNWRNELQ